MTAIDLRQLRLRPGEEHRDTLAVELEPLELGGETYAFEPPGPEATVSVTRMTSGHVFRLQLATEVVGPCVRCLAASRVPVAVDATEVQAASPDSEELETPYLADGKLDLAAWAHDAVALALPDRILCREDCAGLCPVCGKDLNREPHEHDAAQVDPRWAGLEALRDRL